MEGPGGCSASVLYVGRCRCGSPSPSGVRDPTHSIHSPIIAIAQTRTFRFSFCSFACVYVLCERNGMERTKEGKEMRESKNRKTKSQYRFFFLVMRPMRNSKRPSERASNQRTAERHQQQLQIVRRLQGRRLIVLFSSFFFCSLFFLFKLHITRHTKRTKRNVVFFF
ncbi:hypothetical protein BC826DRAFT_116969 [Russula brevipes]|nr:hypothetical protein BC826DRAFT_116969 [Russula brevipes]